ncbi:hypothetical protein [Limnofasciculus baicalensis]|uniref:Uncharacterized protein n=1 Tax=Limnofasciculus baicalensis BBK-W-15 TaxID=2699891 RepID=A0AAE3GWS5_9CYAN|nr:hypothetical protein [Limnofasciculus baicalensis]MCP2731288.1 hypothetical protein [Limnofasciculus baicalensis BBK-W-15]
MSHESLAISVELYAMRSAGKAIAKRKPEERLRSILKEDRVDPFVET